MSLARCVVMVMIPHRMRQGDPTQEIAHSSIFGPLEHEVPMTRHQLIRKNSAWIAIKLFGKYILKRFVVVFLVENDRSSIATVQGMVDRILLVGAFGAGRSQSLTTPPTSPQRVLTPFLRRRVAMTEAAMSDGARFGSVLMLDFSRITLTIT